MSGSEKDMKVGKFLVDNGIITEHQLGEALDMQKDNEDQVIGQILVTQGVLSKEQLIMAIEMYMISTGNALDYIDEWLDQEEVDMLLQRINNK